METKNEYIACHCRKHDPLFCFVPPHILDELEKSSDASIRSRASAAKVRAASAYARRQTWALAPHMAAVPSPDGSKRRLVYDMRSQQWPRPGTLVRSEGEGGTGDPAIDEAYDHAGITYDYYLQFHERNSLDNRGMTLISSVHFGDRENNAYWDGEQMLYGDGDDTLFIRFTKSLEVVAHELTHGVVQYESNLDYYGESGALNEHFADALSLCVEQWHKGQAIGDADWWLGGEIIAPGVGIKGIRTFTEAKAYENNQHFGTDPQPKHYRDKYTGTADFGGVHINSGIPNHAFYRAAYELGEGSMAKLGKIWYATLRALSSDSQFIDAATKSVEVSGTLHGSGSAEQRAVRNGWGAVGIDV